MLILQRNLSGKKMNIIKKTWDKISYEAIILVILMFQFLTGRSLDLDAWSTAWDVMDYSMGNGSRFLIGSIYRFFYGEYLDASVAYKYVAIGNMLTILVLAVVLGRLVRMALAYAPACKNVIYGTVIAYIAAPFSIAYVWNDQNMGRFDVYMLLAAVLAILAALLIKNVYVKIIVITLLGVIGLAIHQGFAFLYYPLVFTVLCYDAFAENRFHLKYFIAVVVSGLVEVGAAVYFQFFTSVNFSSAKEMLDFLSTRTNLEMSEFALELEYFGSIEYQLSEVTSVFFSGNEAPWRHLLLILLILSPILGLYVLIWKDVFVNLKKNDVKLLQSPYLYAVLVNLCFVPMFLIHTDWGRHIAPMLAMPTFVFLFFLAKRDAAMLYAYEKMKVRIQRCPWFFVLMLVWIAMLDSFGARNFQRQAGVLFDFLQYGFKL